MKDNLIKNLNSSLIITINILLDKIPDVVFGGSIVLNALGLIDREIKDIDLFVNKKVSLLNSGFLSINESEILSDTVTDMDGKVIQRTGIKINGVKCCVFKVDKEELENYSTYDFSGKKMRLQNVNYAIQAKKTYSNKNEKHKKDIENINQYFDELDYLKNIYTQEQINKMWDDAIPKLPNKDKLRKEIESIHLIHGTSKIAVNRIISLFDDYK